MNVKEGDCSVIRHNSERITVIDVCNAEPPDTGGVDQALSGLTSQRGTLGNFGQKKHPVNPVDYMRNHDVDGIFRYIQTHPDMDHMDGIRHLFDAFSPLNFWDTDNNKEMDSSSWQGSPYDEADWKFYKNLRDTKPTANPKRLVNLSGDKGKYWNEAEDGRWHDGLHILAPTEELVNSANESASDYNDCSYVLLYRTANNKIVFGGDSHDATWEHILERHEDSVTNVDLLIAPHHGRDSGRSYDFLDILQPTLTFFGNARSEHLAYDAWSRRGLPIVTNNQANCMVVDAGTSPMTLYVTNETFAKSKNSLSTWSSRYQAWYVGPIDSI
ncbi:ComEC/Rec2 family competence protein [Candidatus Poriferisodalis sp.]|uniref:ComEC/Rec2 family competence protein n=1 Tax=Candidatus Poriferisodalis sp. TaxID=3101277 RepID=UPI003B01BCAC